MHFQAMKKISSHVTGTTLKKIWSRDLRTNYLWHIYSQIKKNSNDGSKFTFENKWVIYYDVMRSYHVIRAKLIQPESEFESRKFFGFLGCKSYCVNFYGFYINYFRRI